MGNFEKIIIKKERDKIRRETLGKFFFDLAKLVFAAIVLALSVIHSENLIYRDLDLCIRSRKAGNNTSRTT